MVPKQQKLYKGRYEQVKVFSDASANGSQSPLEAVRRAFLIIFSEPGSFMFLCFAPF